MVYITLSVVSALFLALYDFFKKLSVRNNKEIYSVLFYYTFTAFILSVMYIDKAFNTEFKYICFALLKSLVISVNWFLTTKAVSKLDLGIVTPFSMLGTIFTTILAWIIYGQDIGLIQIVGSSIILIGLILLSRLQLKNDNKKSDYRYLLLLILAAFLSSISAIIDKKLLSSGVHSGAVLFWFFFFLAFIYMIVCLIKKKNIGLNTLKSNLWVIGIGASIFLADLFYYQAVSIDDVSLSVISIVRKLSVFIGVVLASIFLKEDNLVKKILILILMFIGLTITLFL